MNNCLKSIKRQNHPKEKAGWFSVLTFGYTLSIFKQSWITDIEENDLYKVLKKFNSKSCGDRLEKQWNFEKIRESKPSIIMILWKTYRVRYCFYGILFFCWKTFTSLAEPPAMMNFVVYFNEGQTDVSTLKATYSAFIVIFIYFLDFTVAHNLYLYLREIGVEIRTSLTSLIYRKSLKLSPEVLDKNNIGNIVTLTTKDVNFIEIPVAHMHDIWVGLFQVGVVFYMLYEKLGRNSIFGILVLFLTIILQIWIGFILSKLRFKVDEMCGIRLQKTKEAFSDIKLIKMYAWENYFDNKISDARRKEVNLLFKETFLKMFTRLLGTLATPISIFVFLMTHIWFEVPLTSAVLFFILGCLKQIRFLLLRILPLGVTSCGEIYGAFIRISNFLNADELNDNKEILTDTPVILMKHVTVNIRKCIILKNINLSISQGLTCITGSMGSGKSTLLKTLLNNFPNYTGKLYIAGQVSYVSQDPWIFASTIKQNILFGNSYDKLLYEKVLRACCLDYDLKLMEEGHETKVLEKGSNLSKGQQIRINLARALYRESDIYLLDDCFSSLDIEVAEKVFNNTVQSFLKNKLCVYATQNPQHINKSNTIITMENGKIKNIGKPDNDALLCKGDEDGKITNEIMNQNILFNDISEEYTTETSKLIEFHPKQGIYFEDINKDHVPLKTYLDYLKCGRGIWIFSIIILIYVMTQASISITDKLLAKWVDLEETIALQQNDTSSKEYIEASESKAYYLLLYSSFIVVTVIMLLLRIFTFLDFTRVVSIKMSQFTAISLLNAKMYFFDSRCLGNILNRFSFDIHRIDEMIPNFSSECFTTNINLIGIIILAVSVDWTLIIPMSIVLFLCYFINIISSNCGRKYTRLEASTKSYVVGHLNATLEDLATVRSYRNQNKLINEFDNYLDTFISAHYTAFLLLRAVEFSVDVLMMLLIICVYAFFLLYKDGISAGSVGLAISQISLFGAQLPWGMRTWIDLKLSMTSAERLLEYRNIEQERKRKHDKELMPKLDSIKYNNVSLKYPNKTSYALKDINFEIGPQEKIGIVGRTGSGKSSLISVLYRLYDVEGEILINNMNIKTIHLSVLRQNLAIVPQNPMIFSGSIKNNIDPLNEHDDVTIWSVLEKFKLKQLIQDLHTPLINHCNDLTTCQKQLICLARAALRQSSIVIIDEVTASMDEKIEHDLVGAINEHFADKTVITIAHKLKTILHCDKIIVLDKGEVVEVGTPSELIQSNDGYFCNLVNKLS